MVLYSDHIRSTVDHMVLRPTDGIPRAIRDKMEHNGYTLETLADTTGLSLTTIKRRLNRPASIRLDEIALLATAFNCDPIELWPLPETWRPNGGGRAA